ncbi:MAG TPA: DNA mismatch repair protein MutS [Patescibacteria group bacterium]|nr:DNA mismatch repair protein MutS [Patescibacteria group bacterium]
MDATAVTADAKAEYSERLRRARQQQSEHERRQTQLGIAKLTIAAAFVVLLVWMLKAERGTLVWLAAPALAYIVLDIGHVRALRKSKRCGQVIAFYERGIARLENRWMGTGEKGDAFLDPAHPYARDLDVFGPGSLFQLLCTARTSAGQEILAKWLKHPAAPEEIRDRQAAVAELRPRLDMREELAIFAEGVRSEVRPEALTEWGEEAAVLDAGKVQLAGRILAGAWLASLAVWAVWGRWEVTLLASVVNAVFYGRIRPQVVKILEAERFEQDLKLLGGALELVEREKFSAAKLEKLKAALEESGAPPSQCIARVSRMVESLESRRNLIVAVVDPFVLWTARAAFAIESWRQRYGSAIRRWLAAVGEMEALTSLAGYTYEHPTYVFPELTEGGARFEAEGLAHPLLAEGQAVQNDLTMGDELRLAIISGPNMAGKSTFVRAVGINAVLAQCGAPVRARRLRLSPLQVAASICVLDSLQGGVSRFYSEITRLKLMASLTEGPLAVLFLLDELLSGTNSHDRRIGAEAVVKSLAAKGAVGIVTTHDLALTQIVEGMAQPAANFHFEDRFENGELHFDYRLEPGIAKSSNALKLMRSIGLEI